MEENKNSISNYSQNRILNKDFIKDDELSFIIKKTEKVATAIYMISNFFAIEEPLKWDLRKNVTKLLKNIMSFNDASLSNKEIIVSRVNSDFVELGTMFNLAYNSGFISQMNYEIVDQEIYNLSQVFINYYKRQASATKSLFNQNYFEVKENNIQNKPISIKDSIKDIKDNKYVKDKVFFKGQKKDLDSFFDKMKQTKPALAQKTDREEKIIQKIKKSGPVTIKDISEEFENVSEKTIQRELQKMYENGLIKKEGERRWTKYFVD
jgi:DNA-binding transcriptional ArsR family regulator